MRKSISLILVIFVLCISGSVFAADFDFDDLFGDDLFMELDEETSTIKPEEALLVQEGWELGGRYNLSVEASRLYLDLKGVDPVDSLSTSLGSQLYLDARPDPNFRVFGKVGLNYSVTKQKDKDGNLQEPLKLTLMELFSDFNYDNKVFFRAGKQNVSWGVGYFFSPADVINIGRLDPLDPKGDREGPVALKIHYPHRSNNYYLYTLFDGVEKPDQIALAPKMEYVLGKSEIGLGGFYQKDKAPRLMLTLSSSFGEVGFFGEAVVSKGSDKGFVGELGLLDYPIKKKDQLFFHATAGTLYSHNDPDGLFNLTGVIQYYFNGEGYAKQDHIRDFRNTYYMLSALKPEEVEHVAVADLSSTGKHYLAGMLSWNRILDSKFSASASWIANLSDNSGLVRTTLSLPAFSSVVPSIGVSFNYGEPSSEFGFFGKNTRVFAAVTLGSGSF